MYYYFRFAEIHYEGLCFPRRIPVTRHFQSFGNAGAVLVVRHECPDDSVIDDGAHVHEEQRHCVARCPVCSV